MMKRTKLLAAMVVLALTVPAGVRIVRAEESGVYGQTAQTGAVGTVSPTEPSDKRGLQPEGNYFYYFGNTGFLNTGWQMIGNSIYYFRETAADGPRGSAMTGIAKIGAYSYLFDEKGVLQTGWQTVADTRCYCAPTGSIGEIGRMYTGLQTIDGQRYFFDETGVMHTGWVLYKDKKYYFAEAESGEDYGAAYTGWRNIDSGRYYFSAKGVMKADCWISKKYYVGPDGKMLKNSVTPDGYLVDSRGVKGKRVKSGFVKVGKKTFYFSDGELAVGLKKIKGKYYYFDENGVRQESGWVTIKKNKYYIQDGVIQTGWVVCEGRRYHFSSKGKMEKNKVVDGIELGEDGTASISVLLISGHGQGDPGAYSTCGSTYYQEDRLTREFASLIVKQLKKTAPDLPVTLYDQNYDCFQVLAGRKSGPNPNFKLYDYVLEIHFNATENVRKDPGGDGSCKGTSMYVNAYKKDTTLDQQIVAAVAEAGGLPIWGGGSGIERSAGLLNARTAQSLGVPYGLLETAFIDDRDDMNAYAKQKKKMAKAAAAAIADYFGV